LLRSSLPRVFVDYYFYVALGAVAVKTVWKKKAVHALRSSSFCVVCVC